MLVLDTLLESLVAEQSSQEAIRECIARAVSQPTPLIGDLGVPTRGGLHTLYRSDHLTVLNVVWAPRMTIYPHNHTIWAVIGIYSGREDNIFWRRSPDTARVQAAGAKSLCDGDAVALGADIIHSVTNPISKFTGAIHVYGGDFFNPNRKEWDPETLCEQPSDPQHIAQLFEEENSRWPAQT